jgi:Predicted phosphatase/phosphohexomutase
MFYKQSITDVKVVILTLDGGLLDLNRLRYNYYKRLCKHYDKSINRYEFSDALGNMNTMYENSPIQDHIPNTELNEAIEKDLFSYAKLKPDVHKDGIEELLQFFMQRNIKVVVVSTHKTKRAIQYLQLTRLHKYIDFVIGGDSDCLPLPEPSILELVCQQMNVEMSDVLVVANFPSMLLAANTLLMNVVYVPDLAPTTATIEASVYRVAKNPLEIINLFLFANYDTVEMFSPLLGMSANMNTVTLRQTYEQLLKEYADDESLIKLVKQTYQYFLLEIQDKKTRKRIQDQLAANEEGIEQKFKNVMSPEERENTTLETPNIERNSASSVSQENIIKEEDKPSAINIQNRNDEQAKEMQKDFVSQATSLNLLIDTINESGSMETNEEPEEESEAKEDEIKIPIKIKIWDYTVDFFYSLMLSVIIIIAAIYFILLVAIFWHRVGLYLIWLQV